VSQALDLFNAIGDRRRRAAARDLCQAAAAEIEALRQLYEDDGRAGVFDSALATCTETLAHHSLDSRAFLDLELQPERAADAVLAQARFNRLDGAAIPDAARRILAAFYARLRQEQDLLQEVLPDVYGAIIRQGAVLDRVDERTQRIETLTQSAMRRLEAELDKKESELGR
jgi:hypothetical protein